MFRVVWLQVALNESTALEKLHMAFDLWVWKWAESKKSVDPEQVRNAITEDNLHPALTRFDVAAFESSLRERFGSVNDNPDGPFLYDVSDFKGVPANWVTIHINWGQVDVILPQLCEISSAHELTVFDPQSGGVY